jgi:NADH:ubiquinone oxidoreductase subunit 2 (subunit N)
MELNQFVSELQQSISVFTPEVALVSTFIVALLADVIFKKAKNIAGIIALIGFVVTAIFMYGQECGQQQQAFSNMIAIDPFAQFFKYLILLTSAIIVLMSFFYKELYEEGRTQGEYYSLDSGYDLRYVPARGSK